MAYNPKPIRRISKAEWLRFRREFTIHTSLAFAKARRLAWLRSVAYPGAVHHRRKNRRPWMNKAAALVADS